MRLSCEKGVSRLELSQISVFVLEALGVSEESGVSLAECWLDLSVFTKQLVCLS